MKDYAASPLSAENAKAGTLSLGPLVWTLDTVDAATTSQASSAIDSFRPVIRALRGRGLPHKKQITFYNRNRKT